MAARPAVPVATTQAIAERRGSLSQRRPSLTPAMPRRASLGAWTGRRGSVASLGPLGSPAMRRQSSMDVRPDNVAGGRSSMVMESQPVSAVESAVSCDSQTMIQEAFQQVPQLTHAKREKQKAASDELIQTKIKQLEALESQGSKMPASRSEVILSFVQEQSDDGWWIHSPFANALFGSVIVINAMYLGLETDHNVIVQDESDPSSTALDVWLPWFLAESAFLMIFVLELLLRVRALRCQAFRDPWNVFDLLLVSFGIVDNWILSFVIRGASSELSIVTLLRVLRLLKLLRALRILRLFRFFRELTLLAQGILSAVLALGWSLLLILIVLYTSAIFVTEVFGNADQADPSIQAWFGSLGSSFLTLFQLMTLENWQEVVRTTMVFPGWTWSWLFFIPFIGLTNIVLLNVITGVVVERVLSCAASQPEKAEQEHLYVTRALYVLFESMAYTDDDAHAGILMRPLFEECMEAPEVQMQFEQLGFSRHELDHLFGYLETVPNEAVRISDLVDGCFRMRGTAQSKHLLKVQFDILRWGRESKEQLFNLNNQILWVIRRLDRSDRMRRELKEPPSPDEASGKPPVRMALDIAAPTTQPPADSKNPSPPPCAPPPLSPLGRRPESLLEQPRQKTGHSVDGVAQARIRGLKGEQANMSRLLGIFAAELRDMRATVMELKSPPPPLTLGAKSDGEDGPRDLTRIRSSSLIM